MKNFPRPTGELQGDNGAMPNRGTRTGMVGNTADGGRSLDQNATNKLKGISGYTKSQPAEDNCAPGGNNEC